VEVELTFFEAVRKYTGSSRVGRLIYFQTAPKEASLISTSQKSRRAVLFISKISENI